MNFNKLLKNIKDKMGWKDIDNEFECYNEEEFSIDAEELLLNKNIKDNKKHYLNPNSKAFIHKIKNIMKNN